MELPDGPWVWRVFGDCALYTAHSGSLVVLAGSMLVRDENGVLQPLEPDHPVATLIKAAPDLRDALREARDALLGKHGPFKSKAIDRANKALDLAEGRDP